MLALLDIVWLQINKKMELKKRWLKRSHENVISAESVVSQCGDTLWNFLLAVLPFKQMNSYCKV